MSAYTELEALLIKYDETYSKVRKSMRNERNEYDHTQTEFLWVIYTHFKMKL